MNTYKLKINVNKDLCWHVENDHRFKPYGSFLTSISSRLNFTYSKVYKTSDMFEKFYDDLEHQCFKHFKHNYNNEIPFESQLFEQAYSISKSIKVDVLFGSQYSYKFASKVKYYATRHTPEMRLTIGQMAHCFSWHSNNNINCNYNYNYNHNINRSSFDAALNLIVYPIGLG